ncbi:hypothetical protein BS17DRAFT_781828 [Gyrodon lividus]|nr:hypothetical protein BS17DRAFT_781828 [Gyrodon lividus]
MFLERLVRVEGHMIWRMNAVHPQLHLFIKGADMQIDRSRALCVPHRSKYRQRVSN